MMLGLELTTREKTDIDIRKREDVLGVLFVCVY